MDSQPGREIADFIRQEFVQDPGIVLDEGVRLIEEGFVDSLGIFLLVSFLEDRFGIELQSEDVTLENFETLAAIDRLVASKLGTEDADGR